MYDETRSDRYARSSRSDTGAHIYSHPNGYSCPHGDTPADSDALSYLDDART